MSYTPFECPVPRNLHVFELWKGKFWTNPAWTRQKMRFHRAHETKEEVNDELKIQKALEGIKGGNM